MKKVVIVLTILLMTITGFMGCVKEEVRNEAEPGEEVDNGDATERVYKFSFSCIGVSVADFKLYADAGCAVELVGDWELGEVEEGSSESITLWLKNVGETGFSEVVTSVGSTPGYNAALMPSGFSLGVGEVVGVTLVISCPVGLASGEYGFEAYISARE